MSRAKVQVVSEEEHCLANGRYHDKETTRVTGLLPQTTEVFLSSIGLQS